MARREHRNKSGETLVSVATWVPRVWVAYAGVIRERHGLRSVAAVIELALRDLFTREGLLPGGEPGKEMGPTRAPRKYDLDEAA